jgi:hypothetical protein
MVYQPLNSHQDKSKSIKSINITLKTLKNQDKEIQIRRTYRLSIRVPVVPLINQTQTPNHTKLSLYD